MTSDKNQLIDTCTPDFVNCTVINIEEIEVKRHRRRVKIMIFKHII